jgi:hypothetical protein
MCFFVNFNANGKERRWKNSAGNLVPATQALALMEAATLSRKDD